jgi:hypothetical protein
MKLLKMPRQTIADVSATLKEHLARCEEQNKTLFNTIEELKEDIDNINRKLDSMFIGVTGFLATTIIALCVTILQII